MLSAFGVQVFALPNLNVRYPVHWAVAFGNLDGSHAIMANEVAYAAVALERCRHQNPSHIIAFANHG